MSADESPSMSTTSATSMSASSAKKTIRKPKIEWRVLNSAGDKVFNEQLFATVFRAALAKLLT